MTRTFLLLPCLLVTPLAAQEISAAQAAVLPTIIDTVCVNLVDELNGCEQVFLIESGPNTDTADLIILPDRRNDETAPVLVVREFAYNGAMWGMSPSLDLDEDNGRFYIHSEQSGIGRHPWFQTLTVARTDAGPAIIGYDYSTYDRAQGGGFSCSVNLLTGQFTYDYYDVDPETEEEVSTGSAGNFDSNPIPLSAWAAFGETPAPCATGLNEFFNSEM